jgi:hypothetical protein
MTEEEIVAMQATKLDRETPFVIRGVSRSQLSIARFCGGCKFQGRTYTYIPTTDELLRDDVVEWLAKHRKSQRKVGDGGTAVQGDLLTANARLDRKEEAR